MLYRTSRRSGKTLVLFALLLPVLTGMVGLIIDTGMLLTAHRQTQNAADAVALSVALDRLRGCSFALAQQRGADMLQSQFGLSGSVLISSSPQQGPYAGNDNYTEVIIEHPVTTLFIPVLGGAREVTVRARAVAGTERRTVAPTVLLLGHESAPGLTVTGITEIDGTVSVNSLGSGQNSSGQTITFPLSLPAIATGGEGVLRTRGVESAGGVESASRFELLSGPGPALTVRQRLRGDPFLYLATPTTSNGVLNRFPDANGTFQQTAQHVSLSVDDAGSYSLPPGIYASIAIAGEGTGTVTFQPGIYVLQSGLTINAPSVRVVGDRVMFYNTAPTYGTSGEPDNGDGNIAPPTNLTGAGGISITAGSLDLRPLDDTSSPFHGLLIFQRRWNICPLSIQGNAVTDSIKGTLYARGAHLTLSGAGTYEGQFALARMTINPPSTTANLIIRRDTDGARPPQVYLVE